MNAHACVCCGGKSFQVVLDLGQMPLADRLVHPNDPEEEPTCPLKLVRCRGCSLAQVTEAPPPRVLFGEDFPYHSRFSDTLVASFRTHAEELIARRELDADSLVIDLGSNDGAMLEPFARAGVRVLGIDPADGPADEAERRGIPTRRAFFTAALAQSLAAEGVVADVVLAKNVLAHVEEPIGFLRGAGDVLKPGGVVVAEFPSVLELVRRHAFDTVYHEHRCCLSATSVAALARRAGLRLERVEPIELHGGSLRVTLSRGDEHLPEANAWLEHERSLGVNDDACYEGLSSAAAEVREGVRRLVDQERAAGRQVAAYGAAAKGAIMLNWCDLGPDRIDFVVDRNPHKQGKLMPGVRIPVRPVEAMQDERPGAVLVLAWNFVEEIAHQQAEYLRAGGRFIVPIPEPHIATASDFGL